MDLIFIYVGLSFHLDCYDWNMGGGGLVNWLRTMVALTYHYVLPFGLSKHRAG